MYVFLGASIAGRSGGEAKVIARRIQRICGVLERLGCEYDSDVLNNEKIHRDAETINIQVPEQYLNKVSDALLRSVQGLRVKNSPYSLREELACHYWSIDLLSKAAACIWDLTKSSSGSGFEIALALQMRKPCLVLFDKPTISTMLNGHNSRLLVIRRWNEGIEQDIEAFLDKAKYALDRSVRFNVTGNMANFIESTSREDGFQGISDYLRHLVEEDIKRKKSRKDNKL